MITTVFKKRDFTLCKVPVPKGYPQSQTHVGVGIFDDVFYLTTSPFPTYKKSKPLIYVFAIIKKISLGYINLLRRGEDYENPCLYVENRRNEIGVPVEYKLVGKGPLMQKPNDKYGLGSYCSDPDLFIEKGIFNILNRSSVRRKLNGSPQEKYETDVYLIRGIVNNGVFNKIDKILLFSEQDASPCLFRYKERYVYFSLDTNSYNTGEKCKAIYRRESLSIEEGWSEKSELIIEKNGFEPWHMSIFQYNGHLFSILACVEIGKPGKCWTLLGEFSENLNLLKIYSSPLTDYNSYRSSAIVLENGTFVLYNSVVNERIKGGKSVDGREILVASTSFEELLKKLRDNEYKI